MKYKVNEAGTSSKSKTGIKWRYAGKTDDPQATIKKFHERKVKGWLYTIVGIRITDEAGTIVYEEMI